MRADVTSREASGTIGQVCVAPIGWRRLMSQHRQAQWTQRLQALRERLTAAGRYDRAYKAHLIAQHGYARWAHEVFAAARPQ